MALRIALSGTFPYSVGSALLKSSGLTRLRQSWPKQAATGFISAGMAA